MHDDATINTDTKPATAVDLSALTLVALGRLAEHGPDASVRSAARREIEGRTSANASHVTFLYRLVIDRVYDTPCPTVRVSGGHGRAARAAAHELAAAFERALASTSERWELVVSAAGDEAVLAVELMTGADAEVRRAVAMLEAVVAEAGAEVRRPGRRPKREAAKPPAADAPAADAPGDSSSEAEARSTRRRRQKYREAAGADADAFEAGAVERLRSAGRTVPDFVTGGDKGSAYWRWLLDEYRASVAAQGGASVG